MPKLKPFISDSGRAGVKTANNSPGGHEDHFIHAFAQITEQEYKRETGRSGAQTDDYFRVNGIPYVIGMKALRKGFTLQLGQNRYNENYYGVLAAISMARGFRRSTYNVFWVGTHAPEDVDYADDLLYAVIKPRPWTVEWRGEIYEFGVVDGTTIDEPLAGYYNSILRKDGRAFSRKDIERGTTIMVDAGGQTTDIGVIDPGGEIDYSTFRSQDVGVLKAVDEFGRDFRTDNRQLLKGMEIDRNELHTALRTGVLNLRGLNPQGTSGFDVKSQADMVRRELANEVINFYDRYGGAALYDTLILTGGGAALLETELREGVRHNNIVLADKSAAELHMANARGALKWYLMHEMLKTFV